ncbi:MAG TPA: MEDS domain-containing protein, partial [Candidatus Bathyarchaeia archaeon]|nr:MEDS domain-containing protein [Candidatus Bathyarchaeia archaeon]
MNSPRKTGLDMIGDVPWGTHFCQFYQTKEDLADILVPYFKAGLESNEFCMWVTSAPMTATDAHAAMEKAMPDYHRYLEKGQIEVIPHTEWYLCGGRFDPDLVLVGWVDKLNGALAKGYDGLRLSGNTFWLEKRDWGEFTRYEEAVDKVIGNYRMLALCTYSIEKCGASEVMDVVRNHEFALIKRGDKWESIVGYEGKKAEQALKESEQRYRSLFNTMTEGFGLHEIICDSNGMPIDYRFIDINPAFERLTGFKRGDVVGRTVREILPGIESSWIERYGKVALTGEPAHFEQHVEPLGRTYEVFAYCPSPRRFAALFIDVTERARLEIERARLASFPELNPNPVIETDPAGSLRYANPAAMRQFPGLQESATRPEILEIIASISRKLENSDKNI